MRCREARPLFALYLDREVTGGEMQSLSEHIRQCAACKAEYKRHENTRLLVASLGRKQAPPDLALKIRISVSRERSKNFLSLLQGYGIRLQSVFNSIMFPATAGVLAAVIFFGILIGSFMPAQVHADNEAPGFYTPPRREPPQSQISASAETELNMSATVIVKVYVDASGKVQNYQILSGRDDEGTRSMLNQDLLFTNFFPAYAFGQPVAGVAFISFSHVNVKG